MYCFAFGSTVVVSTGVCGSSARGVLVSVSFDAACCSVVAFWFRIIGASGTPAAAAGWACAFEPSAAPGIGASGTDPSFPGTAGGATGAPATGDAGTAWATGATAATAGAAGAAAAAATCAPSAPAGAAATGLLLMMVTRSRYCPRSSGRRAL
uniref:Uncharacterized protein n=1 Tax=Anopheles atroparvus TaxID=41427 RepID=A0AAG5CW76_ANOAO